MTSRSRVEVNGIDLLGGLVHIESVVTDLVAVSDGETAATDGGTKLSGVTVLGAAAILDGDGLALVEAPPPDGQGEGPLRPVLGPDLPGDDLVGPAQEPVKQLNDAITDALGERGTLDEWLAMAGLRLRVLAPVEARDGASATRTAYGVQLEIRYTASGDPLLGPALEELVAPGSLPGDCPLPVPVDCSPDGLVALLAGPRSWTWAWAPARCGPRPPLPSRRSR